MYTNLLVALHDKYKELTQEAETKTRFEINFAEIERVGVMLRKETIKYEKYKDNHWRNR